MLLQRAEITPAIPALALLRHNSNRHGLSKNRKPLLKNDDLLLVEKHECTINGC